MRSAGSEPFLGDTLEGIWILLCRFWHIFHPYTTYPEFLHQVSCTGTCQTSPRPPRQCSPAIP